MVKDVSINIICLYTMVIENSPMVVRNGIGTVIIVKDVPF